LRSGRDLLEFGLMWTAVGLGLLLVLIIVNRIFAWWRSSQAKAASRLASVPNPKLAIHEDDAALTVLIAEANATLAKAPAYAGTQEEEPLFSLPLYLLIGPEGSGKTSTFLNSDLDPQLLAGQAFGPTPFAATRLCNLWLAKNAVFVELSGRLFSGDLARWTELLGVLRGKPPLSLWRRLWGETDRRWHLRGVIGFCDVKELTGAASDPQRLERQSRDWQERLRAVGEVFGVEFPVYQVFTKCDSILYFPDFFRRLPEPEARQVLGCTLPIRQAGPDRSAEVFAQAEPKRLVASFRPLYQALADRRPRHLTHEPDPSRRPNVYEFPREFNRVRSPLVQFLTEVFRPVSLRPGPLLRGYYFSGVREVEAALDAVNTRTDETILKPGIDATRFFSGDATRIFREGNLQTVPRGAGRGKLVPRWMFVSDVFNSVVLADQPTRKFAPSDPRLERYRRGLFVSVCGVCGLLCLAFIWSFVGNFSLMRDLKSATQAAAIQKTGQVATRAELDSLEALRVPVERLAEYERGHRPWSLRWGLYSGSDLFEPARNAYFQRFRNLLLNDLNGSLVTKLRSPGAGASYQLIYDELRTHLMISKSECQAEYTLVSRVLDDEARALWPADTNWQAVADKQIEFYAQELGAGNPLPYVIDSEARDHALRYLGQSNGIEAKYAGILARTPTALTTPKRLSVLAPKYGEVLTGSGEVSGVYTEEGWDYVQSASKQVNAGAFGNPCVTGQASGSAAGGTEDAAVAQAIQSKFIDDYIDHWRNFLAGFSVTRFTSAADAAQKLDTLADYKSPLLALLQMTANGTNFQPAVGQQSVQQPAKNAALYDKAMSLLRGGEKSGGQPSGATTGTQPVWSSPADITKVFQPVQCVVTPGSEKWITEKNTAYIQSLLQLRDSMRQIASAEGNPDQTVYQSARDSRDKALGAVTQIAYGFKPLGDKGVDETVKRLLDQPIQLASRFIPSNIVVGESGQLNVQLRTFCGRIRSTLSKYPFQPSSQEDASIDELTQWFAPQSGEIWKFEAKTLGPLTEKQGSRWTEKDPTSKPQVTGEALSFLNSAQAVADAFFPAGAVQPHLVFILRPRLDPAFGDSILELEIDGRHYPWTTKVQKQFTWPPPAGSQSLGATAWIKGGPLELNIASRTGIWGIFRIIGDAEHRDLNGRIVEWKYSGGERGLRQPIHPAPVQMEIVEFPGGVDVFNPQFYQGLKCPAQAAK
jgi:type VI secretion system protein ImpL